MNDIFILIGRSIRNALRQPAAILPNIGISVFFLFVYNAGLSSVAKLPGFQGSYLGFILPVSIVSAAVGGAGLAGQSLIKDIDNGYFTKLSEAFKKFLAGTSGPGRYSPSLLFDGANGVGAQAMQEFVRRLEGVLNVTMFNTGARLMCLGAT